MVTRPRQLVDPPAFTPLPYGLLSVVEPRNPGDPHWQNGVTYLARCPVTMGRATYDECISVTTGVGTPAPPAEGTFAQGSTISLTTRGATPFTAMVEFDCSPVGISAEERTALGKQAMAQAASYQVEQAFWTGVVDNQMIAFPHLAATATVLDPSSALLQSVPVTGTVSPPYDIADGLGYLEKSLSDCYNGVGVIHMPMQLVPTAVAYGLVTAQGGILRTVSGNKVAAGSGYPGTSPANVAPTAGTVWMYATGAVFAYSGDVRVLDGPIAFDKAENTEKYIAEQTFCLGWDCCHFGVQVSLGVPVT